MNRLSPQIDLSTRPILLVHNRYRQRGGEDRVFDSEVALLRDNGHEVVTYILDNLDISQSGPQLALQTIWSKKTYSDLRKTIAAHNPAIVHFHNTLPLISPSGYYAASAMGIPVVQTLHNYRISCVNALLFREGRPCEDCLGNIVAWRGITRRCYRDSYAGSAAVAAVSSIHRLMGTWQSKIDAYIALSEFSRRKFIAGGLPASKIIVKPNLIGEQPVIDRRAQGYFLFVGRLSAEKGIEVLLEAWERIAQPVELRVAGDGPLADLVQRAASRNPAIRWLGEISKPEVWTQLAGADALVLPSLCYENFPLSLIEAGAAGIPVIASNHGALAELIEPGLTGLLFPPGDAQGLADCVTTFCRKPDLKFKLGDNIQAQFKSRFSAGTNYRQLMEIYAVAIRNAQNFANWPSPLARATG